MTSTHLPGLSVVVNHHIFIEFICIKRMVVHGTKPRGSEQSNITGSQTFPTFELVCVCACMCACVCTRVVVIKF